MFSIYQSLAGSSFGKTVMFKDLFRPLKVLKHEIIKPCFDLTLVKETQSGWIMNFLNKFSTYIFNTCCLGMYITWKDIFLVRTGNVFS